MNCECGFEFSGPGEFRNCPAFVDGKGQSGVICPTCNKAYVDGQYVGYWKDDKLIFEPSKKE